MICPRCHKSRLVGVASGVRHCPECGLRRRPNDTIVARKDTNFRYLNRNVGRTPAGSEVMIEQLGQLITSIHGIVDADVHDISFALKRSNSDYCIAFSDDIEDLVLFAVEHAWWFAGPAELVELADTLLN